MCHMTIPICHMTVQIVVYLNQAVMFLDTSTAEPRSSFWTNEARDLFEPITFSFSSLSDVERYWFQLQSTCLMTPIILSESMYMYMQTTKCEAHSVYMYKHACTCT